jgi:subtilisin family serine protease
MPPAPRRAALALLALVLLLVAVPAPRPAAAQAQAPALAGAPGSIEAVVALGTTAEARVTLRNASGAALTPRLFEALPAQAAVAAAPPALARAALPRGGARVDPQIGADLAASPEGETEFLVFLADQADLSAAYAVHDWAARGELVYRTLRDHAEATQGPIRAELEARGLPYTPLWIVNALAVVGGPADVAALAARAEVAELRANYTASLDAVPAQVVSPTCAPDAANSCWNVARVGASRVWSDFGVNGQGVTVANIDSGVRFDHPALLRQYRGNNGGANDHNYNWYDVFGGSATPVDSGNHGTHTMGTMVARGLSAAEPAVGVAPGARWIAVRACGARECSETNLILAAQWLLAPTDLAGNNPRPELRPQVISNSWTAGQNTSWYAGYTAAWRAAGIYPVFAAGNTGNATCSTVQSPGDYADVTAVGAVDSADRLASFSAIGPGPGGRVKPDLTAPGSGVWSTMADASRPYGSSSGTSMATPHVAAAAALLMAANPGLIGDYDATYSALTAAATPMVGDSRFLGAAYAACAPASAPNNIYGSGRLDTYAAVARVSVDVPWLILPAGELPRLAAGAEAAVGITLDARRVPGPGVYEARVLAHGSDLSLPPLVIPITLTVPPDAQHATVTGRVTRAGDGAPIQATVAVAGGPTARTDAEGRYSLTLPPAAAPYTLTADARDYIPRPATVQLGPGGRAALDFTLEADMPRLAGDLAPRSAELAFAGRATLPLGLRNEGSRTLTYTVSLPAEPFGVWRSDEPDGPPGGWSDPPADAVTLALSDDGASPAIPIGFAFPFAGGAYEQLYVGANGVIAFEPLDPDGVPFARSCLPLNETPGPAIAALRVDLDPSRPGARVSYARAAGGLLVSWEGVPLYDDGARRLSFQALLLPDGRISLRYRDLPALPPSAVASAGVQLGPGSVQSLGCQTNLSLTGGLAVELRPQPPAALWLVAEPVTGQIAPGASAPLALTARWVPPAPGGWPLSGAAVIRTNDPLRPEVRVTVRLTPKAAPNRMAFPLLSNRARVFEREE